MEASTCVVLLQPYLSVVHMLFEGIKKEKQRGQEIMPLAHLYCNRGGIYQLLYNHYNIKLLSIIVLLSIITFC